MPWFGSEAAAGTVAALGMVHQDLELAAAVRAAVEGALRRGRCGTDADSRAAPRRDHRARAEIWVLRAVLSAEMACGACAANVMCLELDCVCTFIDLVLSSSIDHTLRVSGDSDVLTSSFLSVRPVIKIGKH